MISNENYLNHFLSITNTKLIIINPDSEGIKLKFGEKALNLIK